MTASGQISWCFDHSLIALSAAQAGGHLVQAVLARLRHERGVLNVTATL